MIYAVFIPTFAIVCGLIGWLSILSAEGEILVVCALVILNCFPIWLFISRFSRHLIFDAILTNIVGTLSYLAVILIFDPRLHLSAANYCGLALAFIGLILMKIETKNHPA